MGLVRDRDGYVHACLRALPLLGLLLLAVLLANGVPPVGTWLRWLADQIAGDTGWGKLVITLLAGIISAMVAVLTVRLTDRSQRKRAQLSESQRAAESLTRVLAEVWHEANVDGAKPDETWKATQRFHAEQLVQRAVLGDEVLREQVLWTNHALRDWASLQQEASRRWQQERETDSDSGEVVGPDFGHSKAEAWREAFLQVQTLGEDLTAHRRGNKVDRKERRGYVRVELVDARTSASTDAAVLSGEQPTDTAGQ